MNKYSLTPSVNPFAKPWPCAQVSANHQTLDSVIVTANKSVGSAQYNNNMITPNIYSATVGTSMVSSEITCSVDQHLSMPYQLSIGNNIGYLSNYVCEDDDILNTMHTDEDVDKELKQYEEFLIEQSSRKINSRCLMSNKIESDCSDDMHESDYFTNSPYTDHYSENESGSESGEENALSDDANTNDDMVIDSEGEDNFIYF